jgi:hypothetical protein
MKKVKKAGIYSPISLAAINIIGSANPQGHRLLRIPAIVTGVAACGVAHLNCRGVGHDRSGGTSFLLTLGF